MKKSAVLSLHLSFWILIGLLLYSTLAPALPFIAPEMLAKIQPAIIKTIITGFTVFYISYLAAPLFIRSKKRMYLLIGTVFALAVICSIKSRYLNNNADYLTNTIGVFTPPLIVAFIAFTFRFIAELWKDRLKKTELEKEKLHAQLELLKTKLNPHFLFNSLNNIDVLIGEHPRTASEYLIRLSDILRYVLYETKEDRTLLANELEQIKSYIELERIRTDNARFVNFSIRSEANDRKIAPMIFIPFIENAFKHSPDKSVDDAIQIEFDIRPDHVRMTCRNHYDPAHPEIRKNDGLGIEIMKQRLNLLYPANHELSIDKSGQWFTVTLTVGFENGD